MMEAFWSRMQVELLDRRRWKTRVELANAIFEYSENFHNRQLTSQPPWHADPDSVREHVHRAMRSSNLDPRNRGHSNGRLFPEQLPGGCLGNEGRPCDSPSKWSFRPLIGCHNSCPESLSHIRR